MNLLSIKVKNGAAWLLFAALIAGCRETEPVKQPDSTENGEISSLKIVQVDPLEKILKTQQLFTSSTDTAAVAKGEYASFQFAVRSIYPVLDLKINVGDMVCGSNRIPPGFKAFTGYIYIGNNYHRNPASDKIISASGEYPDPLLEIESVDVINTTQPVYISYSVPRSAQPGVYTADIVFTGEMMGEAFSVTKQISMNVYNVELPEQTLWIAQWDSWYPTEMKYMNNGVVAEMYSERHKELITLVANKMRDYGQNVYRVPALWSDCTLNGDTYTFDFTNMDWLIDILIKEGNLKRIEFACIAERNAGWYDPFRLYVKRTDGAIWGYDWQSTTAQNFWNQFYPAFYRHLVEKGWEDIAWQHVGDEPGTRASAESYNAITAYLKSLVPELPIMEAIHSTKEVVSSIDVVIPLLDALHKDYDFYRQSQSAGKELWYYTSMEPYGAEYANRFVELPLIKTRILHWINYRYGITGYLHWAFKSWRNDILNEIPDWGSPTQAAGDCWIAYPAYNKVYSSIRLEAMRDGINDYELLKLLETKDAALAKEIAEGVVKDFDSYDTNLKHFRERRVRMLKCLSQQ
jgi:hypothetical protein